MKSLTVKSDTYVCVHWKSFPPMGAGENAEELRAQKVINDDQYNRILVWNRECALMEMQESKCLTCLHRRKIEWRTTGPVLVDPQGVAQPVVDAATGEASPRNRHFAHIFSRPGTRGSHQSAAWVEQTKKVTPGDE